MKVQYENIPWEAGKWTNEPASVKNEDGGLIVTAVHESDYWEKTLYHFCHRNGHALLADMKRTEAMEVTFRLEDFKELYDQAGMMLWYDENHWIKISIEVIDKEPNISIVVTDEYSDCSNFPVPSWKGKSVTFRVSPFEDAVLIRVRTEDSRWMTVRLARFPYEEGMQAGPMICAPVREELQVTFTRWIKTATDVAQHEDPPIV
ncbi:DUF1349 domain-containing protein [Faecalicatena contorta]|uniref:DUF1349 domain-containing protein n=1 Tax=Faecalicatena contorta TaxID=39482 RepID=A0A316A2T7_9FIRM|nr:DUF1349 domain-containing protein [Faecalicatena contorta]PWJ51862.1 hypothetical protein A8805_10127 [Faecalicatena contorta]SUQ12120.1 hypothetical protein SAMN05216529_10127 [Faecalicatena contorta]